MNRGFKRERASSEISRPQDGDSDSLESTVERGDICSLTVLLITNTLVLEPKQRVCLFYSHKFLDRAGVGLRNTCRYIE
jgi:hypothetical protein